jgi:hypothetical protein
MATNKTTQTAASPASFIGSLPPQQRKDAEALVAMMRKVTGEPPRMWGSSIVGFGTCHYVYESGREGDMCIVGFSARKPSLVLYVGDLVQDGSLMSRLGKHKTGKSCLYIKTLEDVDREVLRELIAKSVDNTRKRWNLK